MSLHHRVIWTQGLFLQPQHFQQQARHQDAQLDARIRAAQPLAWGFEQLQIDEAQLALGRIALLQARGVMPDGTAFDMPGHDRLPPALELPPDIGGDLIVLALPLARSGVDEVDWREAWPPDAAARVAGAEGGTAAGGPGGHGGAVAGLSGGPSGAAFGAAGLQAMAAPVGAGPCRYEVVEATLADATAAADEPEPVQLAAPRLRLLRARDAAQGWAALGLLRVLERRADGTLVLDRGWIAPQLRLDASAALAQLALRIHTAVRQRARTLAAQMGQLGTGVSEVAEFLMLQTLNRHEPGLRQIAAAPSVHPWQLHQALLPLAGELATFDADGQRLPRDYPAYRHDDLQASFAPLEAHLSEMLSAVIQRQSEPIELRLHKSGVRSGVVQDPDLLRQASFVLAVRAQVPAEQLRSQFAALAKLAPSDRLVELVRHNLPAIGLRNLPVMPRQLPLHAGSHYFEVDRHGELWQQIARSGQLALHVPDQFPGLEVELWAIRQAG